MLDANTPSITVRRANWAPLPVGRTLWVIAVSGLTDRQRSSFQDRRLLAQRSAAKLRSALQSRCFDTMLRRGHYQPEVIATLDQRQRPLTPPTVMQCTQPCCLHATSPSRPGPAPRTCSLILSGTASSTEICLTCSRPPIICPSRVPKPIAPITAASFSPPPARVSI